MRGLGVGLRRGRMWREELGGGVGNGGFGENGLCGQEANGRVRLVNRRCSSEDLEGCRALFVYIL
jgi:hypothetical protein